QGSQRADSEVLPDAGCMTPQSLGLSVAANEERVEWYYDRIGGGVVAASGCFCLRIEDRVQTGFAEILIEDSIQVVASRVLEGGVDDDTKVSRYPGGLWNKTPFPFVRRNLDASLNSNPSRLAAPAFAASLHGCPEAPVAN